MFVYGWWCLSEHDSPYEYGYYVLFDLYVTPELAVEAIERIVSDNVELAVSHGPTDIATMVDEYYDSYSLHAQYVVGTKKNRSWSSEEARCQNLFEDSRQRLKQELTTRYR